MNVFADTEPVNVEAAPVPVENEDKCNAIEITDLTEIFTVCTAALIHMSQEEECGNVYDRISVSYLLSIHTGIIHCSRWRLKPRIFQYEDKCPAVAERLGKLERPEAPTFHDRARAIDRVTYSNFAQDPSRESVMQSIEQRTQEYKALRELRETYEAQCAFAAQVAAEEEAKRKEEAAKRVRPCGIRCL